MIVEFGKHGKSLGTRLDGKRIRTDTLQAINEGSFVVFDFNGVDVMSSSFADECIGKLIPELGIEKLKSKTTFQNVNPTVRLVIQKVLYNYLNNMENK